MLFLGKSQLGPAERQRYLQLLPKANQGLLNDREVEEFLG